MNIRRLLKLGLLVLAGLGIATGAWAYWTTNGAGNAAANVGTLSAPADVTATATPGSSTVSVTWTAASLSNGTPAQGYYVTRTNTSNSQTSPACGSSASSLINDENCSDTGMSDGTFTYVVTAVYHSWSQASAPSDEVDVQSDATAPTITVGFPAEGEVYRASTWSSGCSPSAGICGTAADASGVSSVQLSILQQSSGKYWDGTGFNDTIQSFRTATGTTAWRSALALPADGAYTVNVRATDGAGNTTASGSYVVRHFAIDATSPSPSVAATSSSPTKTQPITYAVTFDEPVSDLTAAGVTVTAPAANTGLTKSVSKTDSQHFTVSVGGLATNGAGDGAVSVQVNAGAVSDSAGNAGAASNTASVTWDRTVPTRTALEFFDSDGNGKVDEVKATYNEPLRAYGAGGSPWTLTDVPSGGSVSSVGASGSVVTLTLAEGAGAADTAVGAFKVAYTAAANGIEDAAGNAAASFTATTPADKATPSLTLLQMFDVNTNGKVDQVKATFSESLAAYTAGTAPWALANVPSGGSLASVAVSGAVATLTLTPGAGAADTAVGSFTVALAQSAAGVRDSAGNQSAFTAQSPGDKAGPVPTALVDTDGTNNGKLEQSDTLTVTFSESVTGVAASSNVVLTGANGSNNDTLSMSNLLSGSASLGRSDYISGNGSTASFTGSGLSQPSANQVKVTLAACTGACASLPAGGAAAAGSFTFTPVTSITDAAGNPAAGSVAVSIRLF